MLRIPSQTFREGKLLQQGLGLGAGLFHTLKLKDFILFFKLRDQTFAEEQTCTEKTKQNPACKQSETSSRS